MNDARIAAERAQGARIADRAEDVWGWGTPTGRLRVERRARLLCDALARAPRRRTLEIGSGTGLFSERIAAGGRRFVGCDVSPDLLARARRRDALRATPLAACDAHRLPFARATFDAIWGVSVLHHLRVPEALAEIRRVLVPGGALYLSEPNLLNPQILVTKNVPALKRRLEETPDETAFVRWDLRRRLRRAGFARVRITPFDFWHPALPLGLARRCARLLDGLERIPVLREIAGSLFIEAEGLAGDA